MNWLKVMGRPRSSGPSLLTMAFVAVAIAASLRCLPRQYAQLARQWETDVFLADGSTLDGGAEMFLQISHAFLNHFLRRAGAGRDQHRVIALEPAIVDLAHPVDQIRSLAITLDDLGQAH